MSTACTCDPNTPTGSRQCPIHTQNIKPLAGVGGWLAFFVVICIVVGLSRIGEAKTYMLKGLGIFAVTTGIILATQRRPFAITLAKALIVANGLFALLAVIGGAVQAIGTIIMSVVWFSYFAKSKRVKNTYYPVHM